MGENFNYLPNYISKYADNLLPVKEIDINTPIFYFIIIPVNQTLLG